MDAASAAAREKQLGKGTGSWRVLAALCVPLTMLAQGSVQTGTSDGVGTSANVQLIPLTTPSSTAAAARKSSYTVSVPGTGTWTDAGVSVTPADHLLATAEGTLQFSDGRTSSPAGVAKGWKDLLRGLPIDGANTGALVGRIGGTDAAVPFAVGGSLSQDMPAAGELFLATNTSASLGATGSYRVTLKLSKAAPAATTAAPVNLGQVLTPQLLASLPRRVADQAGDPGDVVNFAILGTEAQVEKAFTAAGWVGVDKTTNEAVLHGLVSTLSKKAYLEMPMSTLYLFGRPQDLSYARADPLMVALERHHLRVWNAGQTVAGLPLWVGSATHDNGLERDQRDNGVTHHVDPNIDTERGFIEGSFASAGALSAAAYAMPANPVRDTQTATGGAITTDGRVLFMVLRPQ